MIFRKDIDHELEIRGFIKKNDTKIAVTYERLMPKSDIQVVALLKNEAGRVVLQCYEKTESTAMALSYGELELFMKKMKDFSAQKL